MSGRPLELLGDLKPPKHFGEVEEFLAYFQPGRCERRRPILVIVGGTNLGKSLLGIQILRRLCVMVGVPEYLEITVEGSDFLDFSEFSHLQHSGVLLDGVGDALLLKRNRELLQGRPKVAKGGQSGTMIYSYPFTLCRRGVVATFDLAAKNLDALTTDHWLSDRRNVIVLHLTETAFQTNVQERPSEVLATTPGKPPAKRRLPASPAVPVLPALPSGMPAAR